MERCRVELITVEELFLDAENIEDSCQWARNFIASQAVADGPKYKLHAIYSFADEIPSDPSPSDAVTQKVAA
jgi:hypothetical protein